MKSGSYAARSGVRDGSRAWCRPSHTAVLAHLPTNELLVQSVFC